MEDVLRIAEKLAVLNAHAKGLLARVSNVRIVFERDENKPRVFQDPLLGPLFKGFLKRFPLNDGLSQVQHYDRFTSMHRDFLDACSEAYSVMVLFMDFRDATLSVFSEVARLTQLSPDLNVDIVDNVVRLLANYTRLNILLGLIEDAKLIAICYSRSFAIANGTTEQNYKRIADYLTDTEQQSLQHVQMELGAVSGRLGEALLTYKSLIDNNVVSALTLRDEGVHNLIHAPDKIKRPSPEDGRLRDLRRFGEVSENLLYGFLACPTEFAKQQSLDFVRAILERGFVWDLAPMVQMPFFAEFEVLANKSVSRQAKAIIADAQTASAATCWTYRRGRRDYCRLVLQQTLTLLKEKPGLVCPKLSQVLSLLGMARDEVLWYFKHLDQAHPKKGKTREEDVRDASISELVFLTEELKATILASRQLILSYYCEYLSVYYRNKLYELMQPALAASPADSVLNQQFDAAIELLGEIGAASGTVSLEPLRMNWSRAQVFLSLPSTSSALTHAFGPIIPLMNEISARSHYVDDLDRLVVSVGGLHELFFRPTVLQATLDAAIRSSVQQSRYVKAYVSVFSSFCDNAPAMYQREVPMIAAATVPLMERSYFEIAARIAQLAHEVAMQSVRHGALGSQESATPIFARLHKERSNSKSAATTRNVVAPAAQPGDESSMRLDKDNKLLFMQRQHLRNMCAAFLDSETVAIYDTVFSPKAFLVEAIVAKTRIVFSSLVRAPPTAEDSLQPIRRPSLILADLQAYLNAFLLMEDYARIDLPSILRNMILEHTDMSKARKLAVALQNGDLRRALVRGRALPLVQGHAFADEAPYMAILATWYVDAALNRLYNSSAVYSPLRESFITRSTVPSIRFERFTEPIELQALCRLIGPNGIRHIEERTLRAITTWIGDLKDLVNRNRDTLESLLLPTCTSSRFADTLKRVRHCDEVVELLMQIGYALKLRDMLHAALRETVRQTSPDILYSIINMHSQYPKNTFGMAGYIDVDMLANAVGVFDAVDVPLRAAAEPHCRDTANDKRTWALLPIMVAASLPVLAGNEQSGFNPNLNAHDNNATFVVNAMSRVSIAVMSLVSGDEQEVERVHCGFVEVGAAVLLRLGVETQRPKEIDAAFLLLQEFADVSPYITAEFLEGCMPYGLIRSTHADLLRLRARKRIVIKEESEAS